MRHRGGAERRRRNEGLRSPNCRGREIGLSRCLREFDEQNCLVIIIVRKWRQPRNILRLEAHTFAGGLAKTAQSVRPGVVVRKRRDGWDANQDEQQHKFDEFHVVSSR